MFQKPVILREEEAEILIAPKFSTLKKKKEKLLPLTVFVQIFLLIRHAMAQPAYRSGSPCLSHPRTSVVGVQGLGSEGFFVPGWGLGGEGTEYID